MSMVVQIRVAVQRYKDMPYLFCILPSLSLCCEVGGVDMDMRFRYLCTY